MLCRKLRSEHGKHMNIRYEPLRCLPWPPGYMQRKMRPNSSACIRPAGVSSPPHFRIKTRDGSPSRSAREKEWRGACPRSTAVEYITRLSAIGEPCKIVEKSEHAILRSLPSSEELPRGLPRGWYFIWTLRFMPEKCPYLRCTFGNFNASLTKKRLRSYSRYDRPLTPTFPIHSWVVPVSLASPPVRVPPRGAVSPPTDYALYRESPAAAWVASASRGRVCIHRTWQISRRICQR